MLKKLLFFAIISVNASAENTRVVCTGITGSYDICGDLTDVRRFQTVRGEGVDLDSAIENAQSRHCSGKQECQVLDCVEIKWELGRQDKERHIGTCECAYKLPDNQCENAGQISFATWHLHYWTSIVGSLESFCHQRLQNTEGISDNASAVVYNCSVETPDGWLETLERQRDKSIWKTGTSGLADSI